MTARSERMELCGKEAKAVLRAAMRMHRVKMDSDEQDGITWSITRMDKAISSLYRACARYERANRRKS